MDLTLIQNELIQKWLQSSSHQQAESDTVSFRLDLVAISCSELSQEKKPVIVEMKDTKYYYKTTTLNIDLIKGFHKLSLY